MSHGRSHLNDYLPQLIIANANVTVIDEIRELSQSKAILDSVDTLGEL